MTVTIAPTAALALTRPAVGIFWLVNDVLVIDRTTLEDAEPYGDCLTHAAGHYERWEEWQALSSDEQRASAGYPDRIALTEYDQWPRGRIVHETPKHRFVIYGDRRLQRAGHHSFSENGLRAERSRGNCGGATLKLSVSHGTQGLRLALRTKLELLATILLPNSAAGPVRIGTGQSA